MFAELGFLWFIIVGLIAGWIGGKLIKGRGFGFIGNIVVGVVGALIGGWLFESLEIRIGGFFMSVVAATVGAVILLYIVRLIARDDQ
ncbi:MAG: GlsB/YeaQ/YmgE family stress response membrane protein [Spirochaetales bacterium]|nr:GlsB/YeaQ/YmgE family stress response membrane protein [Leptospiraceae bacterium]MCP5481424.1 GlsB/YeaQ/YmgE family stress response membrane protein [Spirochaetales bacterium]MCP5486032.1 GlsB/YeaQ/YmgE family stress response membrane protein [Spirochaetales bacterium]